METTINGRIYKMTRNDADLPHAKAHLRKRGFDGYTYFGHSAPVGRQRKHFDGIFLRNAKTGEFVPAF